MVPELEACSVFCFCELSRSHEVSWNDRGHAEGDGDGLNDPDCALGLVRERKCGGQDGCDDTGEEDGEFEEDELPW